ncbi:hypothetical protein BsWGS_25198 [Bradybaena similaris]
MHICVGIAINSRLTGNCLSLCYRVQAEFQVKSPNRIIDDSYDLTNQRVGLVKARTLSIQKLDITNHSVSCYCGDTTHAP